MVDHKLAETLRLNHIIIIIYRDFAHLNSSNLFSNYKSPLDFNKRDWTKIPFIRPCATRETKHRFPNLDPQSNLFHPPKRM